MRAFDHFTPKSLPEALVRLDGLNGQGRVIAGGTDLMLQMRAGVLSPSTIVNIKRLPELQGIAYKEGSGLRLGALTTLRELTRSTIIREHYPVLAQAAGLMASEQIRCSATLGGNLCNASPSADLAPPFIALDSTAVVAGYRGERHIPLEAFFLAPGLSDLRPGELLKEIHVPPPGGKTIYLKHTPRAYMDLAVVGVAARIQLADGLCRRARIVLAAAAPVPLRVHQAEKNLTNKQLTSQQIDRAARVAAAACAPIDDVRGSAWYRRRLVEVLTRRSIEALV